MANAAERPVIDARQVSLPEGHPVARLSLVVAAVGAVVLAAAWGLGGARFYASYLTAYLYFLTLGLGGLVFVLIQLVTRAGWSVAVRRLAEHVTGTLPLFLVLFVPIAVGLTDLYPWTDGAVTAGGGHDALLAHKQPWLNAGSFYVRAALYLVIWGGLGWWLRRESLRQDGLAGSEAAAITRRLQVLSAPGLVIYAVTVTLGSFDFVMSLDPRWYSTIFGVYVFAGAMVGILALVALLALALELRRGPLAGLVTAEHYHDLGKLLFGFVVFWAYIAFSQFMLIWYGNIPEETIWFAERLEHGWRPVTVALALGHFALPFFYLLGRDVKRHRAALAAGAVWLLMFHYLDLYWLVMPSVLEGFAPHWLDVATLLGVGGLFAGALGRLASRPALVPVADPRLPESLSFENA